jgi:hypothetical protein
MWFPPTTRIIARSEESILIYCSVKVVTLSCGSGDLRDHNGRMKMNKLLSTTAILSLFSGSMAYADPSVMLGLALNFGGGKSVSTGVTMKVLSSDEPHTFVGAAGVSYFFDNGGYFGADLGVGRTFDSAAATISYDFLNQRPQISAGWARTHSVC